MISIRIRYTFGYILLCSIIILLTVPVIPVLNIDLNNATYLIRVKSGDKIIIEHINSFTRSKEIDTYNVIDGCILLLESVNYEHWCITYDFKIDDVQKLGKSYKANINRYVKDIRIRGNISDFINYTLHINNLHIPFKDIAYKGELILMTVSKKSVISYMVHCYMP